MLLLLIQVMWMTYWSHALLARESARIWKCCQQKNYLIHGRSMATFLCEVFCARTVIDQIIYFNLLAPNCLVCLLYCHISFNLKVYRWSAIDNFSKVQCFTCSSRIKLQSPYVIITRRQQNELQPVQEIYKQPTIYHKLKQELHKTCHIQQQHRK